MAYSLLSEEDKELKIGETKKVAAEFHYGGH